jgi:thermitase
MKKLLACLLLSSAACNASVDSKAEESVLDIGTRLSVPGELVFIGDKKVVENYFAGANVDHAIRKIDTDANVYRVTYQSKQSVASIQRAIGSQLEMIEPNYVLRAHGNRDLAQWPKDPLFVSLWGLNAVGQNAPDGFESKSNIDIELIDAWKTTRGSQQVLVAMVDTGIDYGHPDLKDNIYVNPAEAKGQRGVDDDNNGYVDDVHGMDFAPGEGSNVPYDNDPSDGAGHGTHTAGTVAAVADNGVGIVGVAPGVKLLPVRALDEMGAGTSAGLYEGLRYAAKMKADVISNSWGGGGTSKLIERAVRAAADAGSVVVFAAGNEYAGLDEKSALTFGTAWQHPNVIVVGAYGYGGGKAEFSNYGTPVVHVFAPGENVLSTVPRELSNPPYAVYSGTSMATPHVAGVAALLLSADPSLKAQGAVKQRLIETSVYDPALVGLSVSNGRVSARRALEGTQEPTQLQLVAEPYHFATPEYPNAAIDVRHKIHVDGAKAVQAHFSDGFQEYADLVAVYDAAWRLVQVYYDESFIDTWTPVVPGDTLYVRFANAFVMATELTIIDTPEYIEISITPKGEPYWSNRSRGFTVDQIAYAR